MKALSIGGRLTLLKSVLGSIPISHMSIFRVPSSVLHTLKSIRSQFFSGHEVGSNEATCVKWNSVLTAKDSRGLGVSSLYALNRGLMMKWVWRFYNQKRSLWANVIMAIHGEDGSMENGKSVNVCTKLSDPSMDYSFRRKTRGEAEHEQLDALMDLVSTVNLVSMGDRVFRAFFFRCNLTRQIARKISFWWNVSYEDVNLYDEWSTWMVSLRLAAKSKLMFEGVFYVMWWNIWIYRNKLLFEDKVPLKAIIFDNVVYNSFYWCMFKCKASCSWDEWLIKPFLILL
nr:RNA-directed DNA polymerase, eukaryota [Tanacetum cinerariifolium]